MKTEEGGRRKKGKNGDILIFQNSLKTRAHAPCREQAINLSWEHMVMELSLGSRAFLHSKSGFGCALHVRQLSGVISHTCQRWPVSARE